MPNKKPLANDLLGDDAEFDLKKLPRALIQQYMNPPEAPEMAPQYRQKLDQREALYQKLAGQQFGPSNRQKLTHGILKSLSGLGYIGGIEAGEAATGEAQRQISQRGQNIRADQKNQFESSVKLLPQIGAGMKLEREFTPEQAVVDPMKAHEMAERTLSREDQAQFRRGTLRNKAANLTGQPKLSEFQKAKQREEGKQQGKRFEDVSTIETELANVDDALSQLKQYKESTLAGTGPGTWALTAGGRFGAKSQLLKASFGKVALASLRRWFSNFARSIDTKAERSFFQATQPDIWNEDEVNASILIGSKIAGKKQQLEITAQEAYIQQNGNLDGYSSPLLPEGPGQPFKVTAVITPEGTVELVSPEQVEQWLQRGYLTPDQWVQSFFGGEPAQVTPPTGEQKMNREEMIKFIEKYGGGQ